MSHIVIVKGNSKWVNDPEFKPMADRFYQDISKKLQAKGHTVELDPGEPYTLPNTKADVWLAHSRGVDRLQYAPKRIKTWELQTRAWPHDDPDHYKLSLADLAFINSL